MPDNPETSVHLAKLEERMDGLERSVMSLISELRERSRLPWPAIAVLVTVLGLTGGVLYRPIDLAQQRIEVSIMELRREVVPRDEHKERWRIYDRDVDRLEKRVDRMEHVQDAKP